MILAVDGRRIEIIRLSSAIVSVRCPECGHKFFIGKEAYKGDKETVCPEEHCDFSEKIGFAEAVDGLMNRRGIFT